jgi:mitochondrial fission protein ELM1
MREPYVLGKPAFKASLHHIDLARSDTLAPPWPDLIITIGRRPSMAALWVREQSGGRTKVVLIGKPSGLLDQFDLVVSSAENLLPHWPNVFQLSLPLMSPDEASIARATDAWRPRLASLRRPLFALLVGGPTSPFVFDAAIASELARAAAEATAEHGGSLYVTTSRRTPEDVVDALESGLPRGTDLYRWSTDATENPYQGLLGLADYFIVTGDSISMMVEVARLGKPLAIFPLPIQPGRVRSRLRRALGRRLLTVESRGPYERLLQLLGSGLYRAGVIDQLRDIRAFQQLLIGRGLAVWFGEPYGPKPPPLPDEIAAVANRIKSLIRRE